MNAVKAPWSEDTPPERGIKLLVMFLFTTIIFVILAALLEIQQIHLQANTEDIDRDRKATTLDACHAQETLVDRYNWMQGALADIDERGLHHSEVSPLQVSIFRARIHLYRSTLLPMPNCGKLPQP